MLCGRPPSYAYSHTAVSLVCSGQRRPSARADSRMRNTYHFRKIFNIRWP